MIEKLCLSLHFACTKLKSYLICQDVYVISKTDVIKCMLSYPILKGRIGKWMLALTEFSLRYVPTKVVKGQVLADFLVDHPCLDVENLEVNYIEIKPWKLYFDGSRHRKGARIALLLVSHCGKPTHFMFKILYECLKNETEYEALIMGLDLLIARGIRNVEIIGDSQLIIKQMTRECQCMSKTLAKYFAVATRLLSEFDNVSLQHVSQEMNEEANELAQIASKYRVSPHVLDSLVRVEKNILPIDERKVNSIDILKPTDWRKPIVDYLRNPNEPVEGRQGIERQAILYWVTPYSRNLLMVTY